MMEFYGFVRTADGLRLEEGKRPDWIRPRNHNFLRLTRILRCCTLLRLDTERRELYGILMERADRYPCMEESVPFWRKAMEPKVVV